MSFDSDSVPALTTSLSTLSVGSTFPQTPPTTITLHRLFTDAGLTPPKNADRCFVDGVRKKINDIFRNPRYFQALEKIEQAKFSFLFLRDGVWKRLCRDEGEDKARDKVFLAVKDEKSVYYKRLEAFIRKGGDTDSPTEKETGYVTHKDHLETFLTNVPEWRDYDHAPTLFNHPDRARCVEPLIRVQAEGSTVCYAVAVANAIYYNQRVNTGTNEEDSVACYAINVCRYMRDHFTDEQVYKNIFLGGGGHPSNILLSILQPHNPGKSPASLMTVVEFDYLKDMGISICDHIKNLLTKNGALIVENFRIFKELVEDESKITFSGNFHDSNNVTQYKPGEIPNDLHAVLVTGVKRTGDGPTDFKMQIQNSWKTKPFFTVTFEFLSSMGVEQLVAVKKGVCFGSQGYSIDLRTNFQSGTPPQSFHDDDDDDSRLCWGCPDGEVGGKSEDDDDYDIKDYLIPVKLSGKYDHKDGDETHDGDHSDNV